MAEPDFNTRIIEEFRANAGKVGGPFEGATLLLLHTDGAKSGTHYTTPVVYLEDNGRYVIFASKAGAPRPSRLVPQHQGEPRPPRRGWRPQARCDGRGGHRRGAPSHLRASG